MDLSDSKLIDTGDDDDYDDNDTLCCYCSSKVPFCSMELP